MALLAATVITVGLVPSAPAGAASPITGGGSSFAALEIDQWRADTARNPFSLQVNYVSQGSTFGRTAFAEGNLDYGATDIEYQPAEKGNLQARRCGGRPPDPGCFVYVPVSAGGVSFMYNLTDSSGSRVSNLRLSRSAACKIFTGAITRWNDPEIVATNPGLAGFNRDIVPVIRADGAGESFVLSEFCIAVVKPVWDAFRARQIRDHPENIAVDFRNGSPVSNWPQEWGRSVPQPFADGTATYVADSVTGKDAITYVAAGYAKVRSMPVASLQNAANVYTQPDEQNVTVALGYATGRGDGTFILNYTGPDPRAYFPSTYSYVVAQTTGFDRGKGETLGRFLCYAVSAGQVIAPQLRYARLSAPLVDIAIDAIAKIPGAPPKDQCFLEGAPAPPPLPGVDPTGPGSTDAGGAGSPEAQRAAEEAAAAQQRAAEEARRQRLAEQRARALDEGLASAAGPVSRGGATMNPLWLLLIGAGLAALAVWVMNARRRLL